MESKPLPGCAIVTVFESLLIGAVGSFLANITDPLLVYLRVDDAVGATCVHGFAGAWGIIAVGIFAAKDEMENYCEYDGLIHGGGGYLLGVQCLAVVTMMTWAMCTTGFLLGVRKAFFLPIFVNCTIFFSLYILGAWISFAIWLIMLLLMVKERHHLKAHLTDESMWGSEFGGASRRSVGSRMSNQSFDKYD